LTITRRVINRITEVEPPTSWMVVD